MKNETASFENTTIQAHFTLIGDEFDTDYVTAFLNRKPDYLRLKGEPLRFSKNKFGHTEWGIHIDESESVDAETHLEPIIDFIEQNLEKLQLLCEKCDAEWHILFCIIIRNEDPPGIVLSPRQIAIINALKAHIGFDMYVYN